MKRIFFILVLLTSVAAFGQAPRYTQSKNGIEVVTLTPRENMDLAAYNLSGIFKTAKKVVYVDSANTFKVIVPKWLKLRQNNDLNFFGGTMPPVNTIENAIVISSVKKKEYKSFQEFKTKFAEDTAYLSGKAPVWDKDRKFLSVKKDSLRAAGNYSSYKVSFDRLGSVFVASYVLVETPSAFLWVQFIATEGTWKSNLPLFKEFLRGLELSI